MVRDESVAIPTNRHPPSHVAQEATCPAVLVVYLSGLGFCADHAYGIVRQELTPQAAVEFVLSSPTGTHLFQPLLRLGSRVGIGYLVPQSFWTR